MHEISLCESVLQILEQQAKVQHYQKVRTIWLEIGLLSGVEIEAMRFGFEIVMKGSLAENARLEILEIPGQASCEACGNQIAIRQLYDLCPDCGSEKLKINNGQQMRIKELEVE